MGEGYNAPMRVLVIGAYGFIGAHVVAALTRAGHQVTCAVRRPDGESRFAPLRALACDMARDTAPDVWRARLLDIDAVVNCAGILRERERGDFEAVHHLAPAAIFSACREAGVRRVVQISAIGDAADSEFVASKHRGDAALMATDLDWTVLRPSVVYTPHGSYGGTSLLRAMAALPWVLPLPAKGEQRLQPLAAEDLARMVVSLLDGDQGVGRVIEAVGPRTLSIRDYLLEWRRWLGFKRPHWIPAVPLCLVKPTVWFAERFGRGPMGRTMFNMLQRGNVGSPEAYETTADVTGVRPGDLGEVLAAAPSHVQDRWHARLYFLRPVLRVVLALLWIASGLVGFATPMSEVEAISELLAWDARLSAWLAYGASAVDLLLGGLLLLRVAVVPVGLLMLASTLAYTLALAWFMPELWLEPFGTLIKNIPLIPAILVMLAIEDKR